MKAGRLIFHFATLEAQDKWLNTWKRKLLQKLKLFTVSIDSPVLCCCDITPENLDIDYIETHYFGDVIPIFKCMKAHFGEKCYQDGKFVGILSGVQATQEDFYWIIRDGDDTHYITVCDKVEFTPHKEVNFNHHKSE